MDICSLCKASSFVPGAESICFTQCNSFSIACFSLGLVLCFKGRWKWCGDFNHLKPNKGEPINLFKPTFRIQNIFLRLHDYLICDWMRKDKLMGMQVVTTISRNGIDGPSISSAHRIRSS